MRQKSFGVPLAFSVLLGCGSPQSTEYGVSGALTLREASERVHAADATSTGASAPEGTPTSADDYVARALQQSPLARSALAHWEAAHARVRASRHWPRPTIGYTALVRPVHTRAGPMRQKVSFGWRLPQLAAMNARQSAAEARAVSASHRFAAVALTVRAQVADAYWRLWGAHARASILELQGELLTTVAEVLRARLATGGANLAAIQQVELRRTRLTDALDSVRSHERHHAHHLAELVALPDAATIAEAAPGVRWPAESQQALLEAAAMRPRVTEALAQASAHRGEAEARHAQRRPQASIRLEWSEVGPAVMAGAPNDGDDALALGLMVALPLDVGANRAAERAANAEARAAEASGEQAAREARLEVLAALARVENTARRAALHESTLEPQALAAHESANARLATEGDVSLTLLALRELLEVRLQHIDALAEHAIAWAALERAVGRPVEARSEAQAQVDEAADE